MKDLIYKRPLLSAICVDLFSLLLCIVMINYSYENLFLVILVSAAVINKRILKNEIGITNMNKTIIRISLGLMIIAAVIYNFHTIIEKITN